MAIDTALRPQRLDSWTDTLSTVLRIGHHPYLLIGIVALLLRLLFLALMLGQHESADHLIRIAPDSSLYWSSAQSILENLDWDSKGVHIFGPGYPTILAAWSLISGSSPTLLLLIQVLVSTLSVILMAELSFQLTNDRTVSIAAGFLAATSLTSALIIFLWI